MPKSIARFILAAILLCVLIVPDFRAGVSQFIQGAALHSGVMNASINPLERKEKFDFDFKVQALDGKVVDFNTYKGKVIFLNLWATWCGPCRAEMSTIQELYEGTDHDKIVFVILSVDESRYESKVKKYISEKNFTFPVFMPSGYLTQQLNVPSIPTTFIIDKDGILTEKEVGMRNYNSSKFKKFLEQLAN